MITLSIDVQDEPENNHFAVSMPEYLTFPSWKIDSPLFQRGKVSLLLPGGSPETIYEYL
jgi:hypothetical protein